MPRDYETDFAAWADEQAQALRDHLAGGNRPVDWAHVIEEVEGLAASDRRELRNRLRVIMAHLFKLRFSQDVQPRPGWITTINEQRSEVETLLDDNRSLRRDIATFIAATVDSARSLATRDLQAYGDAGAIDPAATFTADQMLGDWLP